MDHSFNKILTKRYIMWLGASIKGLCGKMLGMSELSRRVFYAHLEGEN